jgi:DNA-directed RNA polymerase specialized sigma subunit
MDGSSEDSPRLREDQVRLIELYARDPNVTRIAEVLGVHRSTIYRRLDEPGVQDAIIDRRMQLDEDRNAQVEQAQDTVLSLIAMHLDEHMRALKDNPDTIRDVSIQDTQRLMQIAEKLSAMKKDVVKGTREAMAKARRAAGEVDWGSDPSEESDV